MEIKLLVTHPNGAAPAGEHCFAGPLVSLGSDESAALRLLGPGIAAEQAVIVIVEDNPPLLISRAPGTQLNGEPLARETQRPLNDLDQLAVGPYVITCRCWGASTGKPLGEPEADPEHAPSFEQVLEQMRTADDSFYFLSESSARLILTGNHVRRRLGWDAAGQLALEEAEPPLVAGALVRKEWGAVFVEPDGHGRLTVNDEIIIGARQLRRGDCLVCTLPAAPQQAARRASLIFYEPKSLAVLETLLLDCGVSPALPAPPPVSASCAAREYFGMFTLLELLLMAGGTFTGAALIFIMLSCG